MRYIMPNPELIGPNYYLRIPIVAEATGEAVAVPDLVRVETDNA